MDAVSHEHVDIRLVLYRRCTRGGAQKVNGRLIPAINECLLNHRCMEVLHDCFRCQVPFLVDILDMCILFLSLSQLHVATLDMVTSTLLCVF